MRGLVVLVLVAGVGLPGQAMAGGKGALVQRFDVQKGAPEG